MINIGVIGCGHWGPNHIRVLSRNKESNVLACVDSDKKRLAVIKAAYPETKILTDYRLIINDKKIDAVVIATPTKTHFDIAKECLEAGKHVLCEKPLSYTVSQAKRLFEISKRRKKTLMVGHVFLFNAGIRKLREYINNGILGKIYCIYSTRTNLGPIRSDVNVIYDLAPHDISIFSYLLGTRPSDVQVRAQHFLQKNIEDVAFISLSYPDRIIANIHVSWLDPQKVRKITIVGDKKMVVWDDLNNFEPVKLYDKGIVEEPYYKDFGEFHLLLKESDVLIPKINLNEPLKAQDEYFLDCLKNKKTPEFGSALSGLEVVEILDMINKELEDGKKK